MEFLAKIDIRKAVTYNAWLKLIALIIAILVWFYVSGIITGGGKSI